MILCLGILAPTGEHLVDVLQEEIPRDATPRDEEILQDVTLHAGSLRDGLLHVDVHLEETLQEEDASTQPRAIF